jgi:nucleoside phosphorylase
MRPQSRDEFEIGIICALPLEVDAVEALFDEHYDELGQIYRKQAGDANTYTTGRISGHHVVLAYMPGMGNRSSASVALGLRISFTGIKIALVVGICGGVPFSFEGTEIILGDVIISDSVIEYDLGRQHPNGFQPKRDVKNTFGQPNQEIRSFLARLRTRRIRVQVQKQISQHLEYLQEHGGSEWHYPGTAHDTLFEASYRHKHYQQDSVTNCACMNCQSSLDPVCEQALRSDCNELGCAGELVQRRRLGTDRPESLVHIGTIASANTVMRSGEHRDTLAEKERVIGFEMEGAGVWDNLPCVIIKGVCDYADSHKNKMWQDYAAATAASCTKAFLEYWTRTVQNVSKFFILYIYETVLRLFFPL